MDHESGHFRRGIFIVFRRKFATSLFCAHLLVSPSILLSRPIASHYSSLRMVLFTPNQTASVFAFLSRGSLACRFAANVFASKLSCFRCATPKPMRGFGQGDQRPGDWICPGTSTPQPATAF
uniref:Uncharacterized protein n=1 Tax=Chrysotila carterae TaxID=13221 RepID=A0A7S4F1V3_CHRCT